MRQLTVVCLALFLSSGGRAVAQSASAANVVGATSAGAMMSVARVLSEQTWNPILDQKVQEAPAAASLGAAWKPADPRWKKARQALGARMTRIFDAYARSGEVTKYISAELGRIGPGPGVEGMVAALNGPARDAIVRTQAGSAFIVTVMTASPDGPAVGSPEWNGLLRGLRATFDERLGPSLPKDDGTHVAELQQLALSPAGQTLSRLWTFVISNATRQLNTAVNLMILDDRVAIDRDVAAAVAGR
jgi:hypothetical protein